jgi:hypothetical protein
MKPFSAGVLTPREKLFNMRLSGLRTWMTENVYGQWKARFPVLRNMRFHHDRAMSVVMATAILHNMAIEFRDEPVVGDHGQPHVQSNGELVNDDEQVYRVDERPSQELYESGNHERNCIVHAMSPPTDIETRKLNRRIT